MQWRELSVPGAWEVTPREFRDERGAFLEWFKEDAFTASLGHPLRLAQANLSVSAAGVIRGIHFSDVPPPGRRSTSPAPSARYSTSSWISGSARRASARGTQCCWTTPTAAPSTSRRGLATRSARSRTGRRSPTCAQRATPLNVSTASTRSTPIWRSPGRPAAATGARSSAASPARMHTRPLCGMPAGWGSSRAPTRLPPTCGLSARRRARRPRHGRGLTPPR